MRRVREVRVSQGIASGNKTVRCLVLFSLALCPAALLVLVAGGSPEPPVTISAAAESFKRGDYESAIRMYGQLTDRPGEGPAAKTGLLEALWTTGQYKRVESLAAAYLRESPAKTVFAALGGKAARALGRYSEAERLFRKASRGQGQVPEEARLQLALLLEETGGLEESRREFAALYETAVSEPGSLRRAAVAAQHLDRFQEANTLFKKAVANDPSNVDTLNAWGFLFLQKYDAANAASTFEDAQKVNPNHPETLLGLALCSQEAHDGRPKQWAERSLAVNPNLEPARLLLARQALFSEDYGEAQAQIAHCLAVNPNSLGALTLKAVLHSARGETDDAEVQARHVLHINPRYGRLYEVLAEFAVNDGFYVQAVEYFRKALELNDRLWTAYSGLGINLLRIGQEADAREALEIAYARDPFNVWTVNTLRLMDSYRNFDILEGKKFNIRLHKKESALLSLYVPALLEEVFQKLTKKYKFQPDVPLYLEMFPDHEDFAVRTLGVPGLGALGVCFGPGMAMDSPSARPKGTFNWGATLWHEFAHVITLGITRHRIPRWFSEGISVLEEQRGRPGWGDALTMEVLKSLRERKLLPISELNRGFQRPRFPEQVRLSYFQAGEACKFIEREFGFEKLIEMLGQFGAGRSLEQVLDATLGFSPARFDERFDSYIQSRYGRIVEAVDAGVLKKLEPPESEEKLLSVLAAHPGNFFVNLRLGTLYREKGQAAAAIPYLKRAKEIFPFYEGVDNPYRQLAEIHKSEGRAGDAIAELEALAGVTNTDCGAFKQLGRWLKEAGDFGRAARFVEQAIYIDPFDLESHELLAECARSSRDLELALREYRAVLALNPPDKAGAHFNAASILAELGRKVEARRQVLTALEIAPGFAPAQELLLRLAE